MSILSEESALQEYHRAMDEQRIADDAQDAAMVQRWEDFIGRIRARVAWRDDWATVIAAVALALKRARDLYPDEEDYVAAIADYIDSDGLAMCLRAIAQAMDAEAIAQQEVERRR